MDWLRQSDFGVGSHVGNTASVAVFESDESTLSPAGSPGVLDSPRITAGVSNEKDTVVKGSSAGAENSALVGRPVGGIDGNRDGFGIECVLESAGAST